MKIQQQLERPYYRISYRGCARAHDKYKALRNACSELVRHMRDAAQEYEAEEIHQWMRSTGGFTRPHMPYYVTLDEREYETIMRAFREHMPEWYTRARYYGGWI